jgi:hypothetical protein
MNPTPNSREFVLAGPARRVSRNARLLNTCHPTPRRGLAKAVVVEAKPVRRFEQRLRELNLTIPTPWDVREFCANVAEYRGRPITILMLDTSRAAAPCGLWVATNQSDYVVVDSTAPPVLRDHILLHELAHMLWDHEGLLQLDAQALTGDVLDPAMIERVLGRNSGYTRRYDSDEEQDAEGLATVIPGFAAHRSPVPRPRRADASAASVLDRFSSALQGDRGWM